MKKKKNHRFDHHMITVKRPMNRRRKRPTSLLISQFNFFIILIFVILTSKSSVLTVQNDSYSVKCDIKMQYVDHSSFLDLTKLYHVHHQINITYLNMTHDFDRNCASRTTHGFNYYLVDHLKSVHKIKSKTNGFKQSNNNLTLFIYDLRATGGTVYVKFRRIESEKLQITHNTDSMYIKFVSSQFLSINLLNFPQCKTLTIFLNGPIKLELKKSLNSPADPQIIVLNVPHYNEQHDLENESDRSKWIDYLTNEVAMVSFTNYEEFVSVLCSVRHFEIDLMERKVYPRPKNELISSETIFKSCQLIKHHEQKSMAKIDVEVLNENQELGDEDKLEGGDEHEDEVSNASNIEVEEVYLFQINQNNNKNSIEQYFHVFMSDCGSIIAYNLNFYSMNSIKGIIIEYDPKCSVKINVWLIFFKKYLLSFTSMMNFFFLKSNVDVYDKFGNKLITNKVSNVIKTFDRVLLTEKQNLLNFAPQILDVEQFYYLNITNAAVAVELLFNKANVDGKF
jgi:hypothetical protein